MRKTFYVSIIAILVIISCKKPTIDELYEDKTGKGPNQVYRLLPIHSGGSPLSVSLIQMDRPMIASSMNVKGMIVPPTKRMGI